MYRGVLIPVITPFHEDSSVDEDTLRQLVDFYFRAKVHGLFALGSSGQGPALSADERKAAEEQMQAGSGWRRTWTGSASEPSRPFSRS